MLIESNRDERESRFRKDGTMKRKLKGSTIHAFINKTKPWYKKGSFLIVSLCLLFIFIGVLTTIKPAYRLSSSTINEWTRQIDGSSFLYVMGMENKAFKEAYPEDSKPLDISELAFQMATSLKPNDPRSLLGRELPGFASFDSNIVIAGEGTDYTNLPIESSAPLDVVLEDREATMPDESGGEQDSEKKEEDKKEQRTTGEKNVVYIYNSHNTESFLPHLPEGTGINEAHHSEVNITKVSDRLAQSLEENGIGSSVETADIASILDEKGWEYYQSYNASKPVVKEALANNKDIQFIFDLHRDSQPREVTTKKIDGKAYAKLFFVVGGENANYEQNLKLATDLHNKIQDKYPGLSRGVITKKGPGTNGVFNQDLSENAVLIEFGGVENKMDELYRSADIVADIFSDYYWQAEKVQGNS